MNLYLQVFLENAHAASVVPMASSAALLAMKAFGGYNMPLAYAIAVAGAVLGQTFNWYVGVLLRKTPVGLLSDERYRHGKMLFHKYGIFLLLLCWAPIMNFVTVAAGFLEVRLKTALPLIILGTAAWFGWLLK